MKRFLAAFFLLLLVLPRVHAQTADDSYLQIYGLIQEGDDLSQAGQSAPALGKYRDAQNLLERFQKAYPAWNSDAVTYRLNYLSGKIAELAAKVPASAVPAPVTNAPTLSAAELQQQIRALQEQLRQSESDKQVLQARVKEAFAVQPATADTRELTRAQQQVETLQRENVLLKVSLETLTNKLAAVAEPPPNATALKADNKRLEKELADAKADASKVSGLQSENETLRMDKTALEERVKQLMATNVPAAAPAPMTGNDEALKAENKRLETELGSARTAASKADALQATNETLRLDNIALQDRVKQLMAASAPAAVPAAAADSKRVRQLESQCSDLQQKLDAANKELHSSKRKPDQAQVKLLTDELNAARDRLAIYEAQKVPYTPEELALLKTQDSAPAAPATPDPAATAVPASPAPAAGTNTAPAAGTNAAPSTTLPPEALALRAEADALFASKKLDQAEAKYIEILRMDEKNVDTLANLATIQMELNHYDDAEKHLKQALAIQPDDSYALSILGNMRFRQGRYDESVDALSRAAKLDPQSAQIQNFMGLSLSELGQRKAAEAALRKAIQLDPNYADAHNNLAVFYATDKPPALELARFHYQRALSLGHAQNAELEKLLNQAK